MDRGEFLRETLIEIVKKEKINCAVVVSGIATFDEARLHMITTFDNPAEFHIEHLREPLELASLDGAIINYEPHLHGVVGSPTKSWAGHILDGCRILYLGEFVIQELTGIQLERREDEDGTRLIYEIGAGE